VLRELAALRPPRGAAGEWCSANSVTLPVTRRGLKYHKLARRGWPIGSGAWSQRAGSGNVGSSVPASFGV